MVVDFSPPTNINVIRSRVNKTYNRQKAAPAVEIAGVVNIYCIGSPTALLSLLRCHNWQFSRVFPSFFRAGRSAILPLSLATDRAKSRVDIVTQTQTERQT
ncbi:Hypothetical protein NTJ_12798 [Nesidiocoris tenuis]|uniref:Uncharacterized protein n=1 Tax=Nesidiocoris tenuis TaxID=355587 RepID=A0ABN7B6G1_9HEMI|nr:Hypothetical protein NTJ_12798 [Nesidiocoris tenuis]